MAGKPPTYVGPSGPIPMEDLTGDRHNHDYNREYFDPRTISERLPARPRDRSALEKTFARWCCGSILGVIAWIVVVLLLITVPIVVFALKNMNDKHGIAVPANITTTTIASMGTSSSTALSSSSIASPSPNTTTTMTVTLSPTISSSTGLTTITVSFSPTSSSISSQIPTTVIIAQTPSVLVVPIYITTSSPSAVPTVTTTIPTTVGTTTIFIPATLDSPDGSPSQNPSPVSSLVLSTSVVLVTSVVTSSEGDSPLSLLPQAILNATATTITTRTNAVASTTPLVNPPAESSPHTTPGLPTLPTAVPATTDLLSTSTKTVAVIPMTPAPITKIKPIPAQRRATALTQQFPTRLCTEALGPLAPPRDVNRAPIRALAPTRERELPHQYTTTLHDRICQPYVGAVVLCRTNSTKLAGLPAQNKTASIDTTTPISLGTRFHDRRDVIQLPRRENQVKSPKLPYLEADSCLGRLRWKRSISSSANSTGRPTFGTLTARLARPAIPRPRASGTSIVRARFVTPVVVVVLPDSASHNKHGLLVFVVVALALLLAGGICAVLLQLLNCWQRRRMARQRIGVRSQSDLRDVDGDVNASGPGVVETAAIVQRGRRGGWPIVRSMSGRAG